MRYIHLLILKLLICGMLLSHTAMAQKIQTDQNNNIVFSSADEKNLTFTTFGDVKLDSNSSKVIVKELPPPTTPGTIGYNDALYAYIGGGWQEFCIPTNSSYPCK